MDQHGQALDAYIVVLPLVPELEEFFLVIGPLAVEAFCHPGTS
jgi:hypothetical protein